MNDETAARALDSSCAAKVLRYVVLPLVVLAIAANSRDIYKYIRLVAMSTGGARDARG
jgi:hypothetical protein